MKKAAVSKPKPGVKAITVKPVNKPVAKPNTATARKPAAKKPAQSTGQVLSELKLLARELSQAAKGLGKRSASSHPREVSSILVNVERMTAEAATKSLIEAESAKQLVSEALASLGKDWNRRELDSALKGVGNHLTNIIVAQEFQDLAGQALRKAVKALVGAIIVVEGGGSTEEQRLSQRDVDSLLKDLMP
ncbi:MAG: hypothetical protein KKF85_08300 [Gammaproteobacteria bacterium]|nr:hypothetical protein [Rhodocyclaceae bacterium]MBU3910199.1 hypothetical protein [Gammaproteobacteria bacterium]MBU3988785.1 hypothetical protein [Gammaproteobacteria bacterium]MBU4006206.1 hypothetical protein [Gammaproteobacteria bacterium]MBU4022661.1 hypothetical protein [Gammaproteobacteria bacterium]